MATMLVLVTETRYLPQGEKVTLSKHKNTREWLAEIVPTQHCLLLAWVAINIRPGQPTCNIKINFYNL